MQTLFSDNSGENFDLADFETTITHLSHATIIFPEAPGSFAETGYFSALPCLAKKSILVLDLNRQGLDTFLSLGPAKKYEKFSIYSPVLLIDYTNPDFDPVFQRIQRIDAKRKKKHLAITNFKELSDYDLFCLLFQIINLLRAATFSDIKFFFNALFRAHFSAERVRRMLSILVGAGHVKHVGEFGHFACDPSKRLAFIREGHAGDERALRMEIALINSTEIEEFAKLVGHYPHVA